MVVSGECMRSHRCSQAAISQLAVANQVIF